MVSRILERLRAEGPGVVESEDARQRTVDANSEREQPALCHKNVARALGELHQRLVVFCGAKLHGVTVLGGLRLKDDGHVPPAVGMFAVQR